MEASELIKTEDIEAWRKSGARPTSRDKSDDDRTRIMVDPKNPGSPANGVNALGGQPARKKESELEKTNLRGMVTRGRGVDEMTQLRPQTSGPEVRANSAPPPPMFSPPPQASAQQPAPAQPPGGQGFVSPGVLPAVAQAVAPAVANAVAAAVVQAVGNAQATRAPLPTPPPTTGSHRGPAAQARAGAKRSVVSWAAPVSLVVSLMALAAVLIVRGDWFQSLISKDTPHTSRVQEAAATVSPPVAPDPQPAAAAPSSAPTDATPIATTAAMDTTPSSPTVATTPVHARHWGGSYTRPAQPAATQPIAQRATAQAQPAQPTPPAATATATSAVAVPPTAADSDARNLSNAADKELENLIKP